MPSPFESHSVFHDIILVFHFLKRVLCGIVPLLLASDPCLISQFPSPIQIRLFPLHFSLALRAHLRTQLFCFKKISPVFPPGVELCDILIAFHYFQQLPLPTPDSSLSFSHHPLPGLCKKVGRNSACCLYPLLF